MVVRLEEAQTAETPGGDLTSSGGAAVVQQQDSDADKAMAEVARLVQGAAGTEETRFSNLNTRAVNIVSASSLVTALAGVFSKDLLTDNLSGFSRIVASIGFIVAVLALAASTVIIVVKVLIPGRRVAFGNNPATSDPRSLTTVAAVSALIWAEYSQVHASLQARNSEKARALQAAYVLFATAVIAIAISTGLIAIDKIDGKA